MGTLTNTEKFIAIGTRGMLGKSDLPDPLGINGIYRIRKINKKVYKEKMAFYPFVVTHTIPQDANRTKFKNGIDAWYLLTPEMKLKYKQRAIGRSMTGYNLFIKEYMLK